MPEGGLGRNLARGDEAPISPCMILARRTLPLLALPALAHAQAGETVRTARGPVRIADWATGLEHPWGAAVLPDGRLLVTERPGRLRLVTPDGRVSPPLPGVPPVLAEGQGGLLDIALLPGGRELFLSTATLVEGGAVTRLWRGRLGAAGLEGVQPVLDATPAQARGRLHYGGRMAVSPDGAHLFLCTGERNEDRLRAQRLDDLAGKILRLTRDGTVPRDNPFAGRPGARAEIWSFGHRNPQGIAFHPGTGTLFSAEFGPLGGDELNVIRPGRNYGWPLATTGREYSGRAIAGAQPRVAGFEDAVRHWEPSISPSGIGFAPPGGFWRGDLFLACQSPPGLVRLPMTGDAPGEEERLFWGKVRMRHVVFAPDGAMLILTDEERGRILRVTPA